MKQELRFAFMQEIGFLLQCFVINISYLIRMVSEAWYLFLNTSECMQNFIRHVFLALMRIGLEVLHICYKKHKAEIRQQQRKS